MNYINMWSENMLRLILLALPLVLCGLLHAPASAASPACTSFVTSDGGSICLPMGWKSLDWKEEAQQREPAQNGMTCRDQTVFMGQLAMDGNEYIILTVGRTAACTTKGHVLAGPQYNTDTIIDSFTKEGIPGDVLDPKRTLHAGGKDYVRLIKKLNRKELIEMTHFLSLADAVYIFQLLGPISKRAEMERLSPVLLSNWYPASGPLRLAGEPEQEWRHISSKHIPAITMAIPSSWICSEERTEPVTDKSLPDIRRVAVALAGVKSTSEGKVILQIHTTWSTGRDGSFGNIPPEYARNIPKGVLHGISEGMPLKPAGKTRNRVGPLALDQFFYTTENGLGGKESGVIIAFISGPSRVITACLVYENLDDASWRAFLPEMFRRWEFSPSELKALGAAGPRS